ncbi:MAG: dihydrofolate reductase family protein [Chryseolinea sp.]
MRKIILNLAVSLDGFIEGPKGEIDWCIMDSDPVSESSKDSHFDQFLSGIDTIFYGRVSYDLWGQYQPDSNASLFEKKLWQSVHSKSKYVFSTKPKKMNGDTKWISENVFDNVMAIKNQPGKSIWLYGGASLITTFINLELVDNYLLAVHPIILGGGKPLFSDIKDKIGLKLNGAVTSPSGVILLDYDAK